MGQADNNNVRKKKSIEKSIAHRRRAIQRGKGQVATLGGSGKPLCEVMSDLKCSDEKELAMPRSERDFDRHKKELVQRP